jgi:hypothetical protein
MKAFARQSLLLCFAAAAATVCVSRTASAVSSGCEWVTEYYPPQFTNVGAGDAVLYPANGNDPITSLFQAINLQYTHVALGYDYSGQALAESAWNFKPPPSTSSTGGDHACSRVLAAGYLQNLAPGTTGTGTEDDARTVNGALVIQGAGTPFCNSPADAYHFNSFVHDDVYGGSCEKYVVDYCGVPVQDGDRVVLSGSQLNTGLVAVYGVAYQAAIGMTSGLPWYDYAFCGGVDSTILAQRATMQVTNEILWKWWQLEQPDGNSTDYLGIDNNAKGVVVTAPWGGQVWEDLGGGAQNTQWTGPNYGPSDYCTDVNTSNQTPNGQLQGEGADCPSWNNYGNPVTMNVPDDVLYANQNHMGQPTFVSTATSGYYVRQYVCN